MAAENATKANDPDYTLAASILRDVISGLRDVSSKNAGDLSAAWKRVEKDAGVNKAAAKVVFSLLQKSDSHQDDFMRTLLGMAEQFHLYPHRKDLVDAAEQADDDEESEGGE